MTVYWLLIAVVGLAANEVSCQTPTVGPCRAAGYESCCEVGFCYGDSDPRCYCDLRCFTFGDCCSDIDELGCLDVAPPTEDTQPPFGSCAAAGYNGCCQFGSCYGNVSDCRCDEVCFVFDDCCSDIHEIGCYEDVPPTDITGPPPGSCAAVGYNGCCQSGSCHGSSTDCFCDERCFVYGDCCSDIHEIGCHVGAAPPTNSTGPPSGSCTAVGYDGCCPSGACYGNVTDCSCDQGCFTFDGCCSDIHEIGCFEYVPPTNNTRPPPGPCQAAGYHGCCQAGYCYGNFTEKCYCDARCFTFDDCCSDIYEIGCYIENETDCNLVHCLPPPCPNPIPADLASGKCCPTCPVGSRCPVAGQVFQSCASPCNATCSDPKPLCIEVCQPGCGCPSGHVIDQQKNKCVPIDSCPVTDICQLPAEPGNCSASIGRYYYSSDVGKCQSFTYSGCNGNGNNFKSMNGCRKLCHKEAIDCTAVKCAVPTCPNPNPPNPAEGECCSICPLGSSCPIKGQVYHECVGCPPTCDNYDQLVLCPAVCVPGCACPHGQVFDERRNTCVHPEKCPGTCELYPSKPGGFKCTAYIPRYFYSTISKQCERFIDNGCHRNENNFETLLSCEKSCSECAPTCSPDFCSGKLKAKCSIPKKTHDTGSCFGECDETVCSACYYSNETLVMPTLEEDCPTLCPVDAKGEIFGMTCLREWGKCVRRANLDTYGKPSKEMKATENFKCWRPSCPSYG